MIAPMPNAGIHQESVRLLAQQSLPTDPNADTLYQLLGIDFRATPTDVTRAYRRMMKAYHPDVVPASQREEVEELCRHVNHAYTILSDPIKRREYDRRIRVQELQDQIMNRYVGGLGGPGIGGHDLHGKTLKRTPTDFERAEIRRADRSAMFSLIGAGVALTLGAIGLLLVVVVLTTVARLLL